MSEEPLPVFVYHPDPLDTGSIVESDDVCLVCGRWRGYLYKGPVSGLPEKADEIRENICPWCIADGSAHRLYDAEFTGDVGRVPFGEYEPIPDEVSDQIRFRTPGYTSWQSEYWWAHCGDGAMFLGLAGTEELEERWPAVIPIIWQDIQQWNWGEEYSKEFMEHLHERYGPTVYVFQCRHCGEFGAYWDCH